MRTRKLLVVAIAAACVIGLLAVALLPSACPADLSLVSMKPSGILDEDGTEPWLVTLNITNCSSGALTFDHEWISVNARVMNRWVPAKTLSHVGFLASHSRANVDILVPFATQACQLGIKYVPEPLNLRLMHLAANLGLWRHPWYQSLAPRLFPVGWLQPVRSDYIGHSPHWRLMNPELTFPQRAERLGSDVPP